MSRRCEIFQRTDKGDASKREAAVVASVLRMHMASDWYENKTGVDYRRWCFFRKVNAVNYNVIQDNVTPSCLSNMSSDGDELMVSFQICDYFFNYFYMHTHFRIYLSAAE